MPWRRCVNLLNSKISFTTICRGKCVFICVCAKERESEKGDSLSSLLSTCRLFTKDGFDVLIMDVFVLMRDLRNDKNEILSSSMQEAERHVDHIKNTLTGAEKKLANCLVSVPDSSSSSSTNATPERKLKKIPSSSLSNFFNEASESLATSRTDSVLRYYTYCFGNQFA